MTRSFASSSSKTPDDELPQSTKTTTTTAVDKKADNAKEDKKVVEAKSTEKSEVDKEKDKDSEYVIIGPDGVPYDPSKDPEYTNDYYSYKYPQYFTKHLGPKRVVKVIKEDINLMLQGRIHKTREEIGCPNQVDVAIFGGGIIGASVAYFLREKAPFSMTVGVFERDPTVSAEDLVVVSVLM